MGKSENFDIYEDVEPVLEELRAHGLRIGLVSNGARDLREFVRHHGLDADVTVASRYHGKVKPAAVHLHEGARTAGSGAG